MSFICEFCEATFNKKSSLTNHNKNAKYCLIKRGKIVVEQVEEVFYNCKYCKYTQTQNLELCISFYSLYSLVVDS